MNNTEKIKLNLKKRYNKEKRFQFYGRVSVLIGLAFLAFLLVDIGLKAWPAFSEHQVRLQLPYVDLEEEEELDARTILKDALVAQLGDVRGRTATRELMALLSIGAEYELTQIIEETPEVLEQEPEYWFTLDNDIDTYLKEPHLTARLSKKQIAWVTQLQADGQIRSVFNFRFFTGSDSREPELAGILGALAGSILTALVTLLLAFPLGVLAAIYLEEFAPRNRFVDIIEININNLAAVPSIIFGLLGLAVFINVFHMPRSAPIVGGCVLALMTLPTIIIASRAAIKAVPPSIREAAIGIGASKMQTVFQHVVPSAMPGILTGSIIGMAQALGETAPLLMIGMVAFIVDVPQTFLDPATVLPVQIFLWADSPERAFLAKTSAAILVLLSFLIVINAFSIFLRKKFEKKW